MEPLLKWIQCSRRVDGKELLNGRHVRFQEVGVKGVASVCFRILMKVSGVFLREI